MTELQKQTLQLYARQLRLPTFTQCEDVVRQMEPGQGYADFLIELMKRELDAREDRAQKRRLKQAGFPYLKTFDELDLSRFEHVSEATLQELMTCDFIRKRQNVVMIGNPGSGKTHLSLAIGIKACSLGYPVRFFTAANLTNALIEAQDSKQLQKLEKQIEKADLLIIDELSYLTYNLHQSELLYKVISDRAERRSIIVSTNLKFSEWSTMFENKTMVTAMIGRLTFRSHVLNMNSSRPYRTEYAARVNLDDKES